MESRSKAFVVWLIASGNPEKALELLTEHYAVSTPRLKVGLPKGHKRNSRGCYDAKAKTISVLNSDVLKDPYTILHEFYHHLRTTVDLKHRGTEKNADAFAKNFVQAYRSATAGSMGKN